MTSTLSREALLTQADANLAAGIQYGLWVERSPSVEEQISLSSMSQDKLGHARAYLQLVEAAYGEDATSLQYDRSPDAFLWPPAWVAPLETWYDVVVGQVLLSRALIADARAFAQGTAPADAVAKLEQEEVWHTRHGDAWLSSLTAEQPEAIQAALDRAWPRAVCYHGAQGTERFPEDVEAGLRTPDDQVHEAWLAAVVPVLEDAGLQVAAEQTDGTWTTDPVPTDKLLARVRDEVVEHTLELVGLLQDPEGREIAETV